MCRAGATLDGGFVKDDDFGFERGDCQAVAVTGGLVIMESDEELVAGDGRESQYDIPEEYDGRVVTVGAFMLVGDV